MVCSPFALTIHRWRGTVCPTCSLVSIRINSQCLDQFPVLADVRVKAAIRDYVDSDPCAHNALHPQPMEIGAFWEQEGWPDEAEDDLDRLDRGKGHNWPEPGSPGRGIVASGGERGAALPGAADVKLVCAGQGVRPLRVSLRNYGVCGSDLGADRAVRGTRASVRTETARILN